MGTPDSREYDRLKGRKFRPYSRGHQMMYLEPIGKLKKHPKAGELRIFEAGFGIGWGLDQMAAAGIFASGGCYVGCEPNKDSFDYTNARHENTPGVYSLFNKPFGRWDDGNGAPFDVAFCIEVIEHVPAENHLEFLTNLRKSAPLVYFSTPDIQRVPKEGVRTTAEWVTLLRKAGFKKVSVNKRHWTYLYTCES